MKNNNWLKAVNDLNKSKFSIPEGWDTKEQVAEKLQCAPDRVADLLRVGLQTGDFEKHEFNVWDDARRLATKVMCFRIADKDSPLQLPPRELTVEGKLSVDERIRRAIINYPHESNSLIARRVYKASAGDVRRVREEMGGAR